jgi:uncharacterized NAD(P)/FAD-binding protein YdhS
MPERVVVVVGGGASGTLLTAALTRGGAPVRVAIVEPRERLGSGVAYATTCEQHLMNAPASAMSAFADEPDHFVRWLGANAPAYADPLAFVPRPLYADYLHAVALDAHASAGERLRHVRALAVDAEVGTDGVTVRCDDGTTLRGDALVLATGNSEPAAWPRLGVGVDASPRFFRSAWDSTALVPTANDEAIVLLGSGLTAVDAVLALRANGHCGTITMVSRRGLLPHEHRLFDAPPAACPDAESMRDLLGAVRALADGAKTRRGDWRGAVDRVRPQANTLWQALTLAEQRRFVRHVMPYWNVHRHRVAPAAAKTLAELIASGTVRTLAGRTGEITATASALRVPVRLRSGEGDVVLDAGRVINCSGPEHDLRNVRNPLLTRLLAQGAMAPNPLGLGVRVASDGALVDANSNPSTRLYALGPVRYGTLIETTAIPEIADQARELAALLGGAQGAARTG